MKQNTKCSGCKAPIKNSNEKPNDVFSHMCFRCVLCPLSKKSVKAESGIKK